MRRTRLVHLAGLTAILVMASTRVSAQTRSVRVGVLAGTSIATLTDFVGDAIESGSDLLKNKNRIGFQGGLFATIPLRGALSLQPEVQYVQKGAKFDATITDVVTESLNFGLELAYIDIPVLARLDLARTRRVHPFLVAGPSFSLRTSCNVSFQVGQASFKSGCGDSDPAGEVTATDPVKKTDLGVVAGIGLASSLMGRAASVQLRFSQSLTSIASDAADTSGASPRNRGISVLFGLSR